MFAAHAHHGSPIRGATATLDAKAGRLSPADVLLASPGPFLPAVYAPITGPMGGGNAAVPAEASLFPDPTFLSLLDVIIPRAARAPRLVPIPGDFAALVAQAGLNPSPADAPDNLALLVIDFVAFLLAALTHVAAGLVRRLDAALEA